LPADPYRPALMKARTIVIIVAVAAVAIAIVVASMGGKDSGGGGGGGKGGGPPKDAIKVSFAYSPEKEALIKPIVERFNGKRVKVDGKPVFVEASVVSSGDAETRIAKGTFKPVAWSPASSLWGRLLNFDADKPYVADDNPSIVRTPLVIAMWKPLADALGYPRKPVGFAQILALATSQKGWAAYGKPQFGRFKLGHTNPDFSTSGLSAVAAEYFTATGKREGLTPQDVSRPAVRAKIKAIERSIVHYGDTTLFFAEQLARLGPGYASAVAMEEVTLIDYNRRLRRGGEKLVGIYPSEGTFFSDSPYIVLDAPWVTDQQKQGADAFGKFLADQVTPATASAAGFRDGDPDAKPGAQISKANGADPAQPKTVLSAPQPRVLDKVRSFWRQDRKPANIMLVVDTSGSMSEENKLAEAQRGLRTFFREIAPQDRVGLTSFNDQVFKLQPVRPFRQNRAALQRAVDELIPDGETAVYDATENGFRSIQDMRDESRINAVVVLTDGEDNQSNISDSELASELRRQATSEGLAVRVYTIAYGSQANKDVLSNIAQSSGGKAFEGDPKNIDSVYRSISSFF
jgi:Ca-activated chloride channel family protein